jgi:hypothetical protein
VSGETRIDSLVSTKDPQLIQIEHTPGESRRKLVERIYPLVAEGISNGLFLPPREHALFLVPVHAPVRSRIRRHGRVKSLRTKTTMYFHQCSQYWILGRLNLVGLLARFWLGRRKQRQ